MTDPQTSGSWLYEQTPEAPPQANGELVFEAPWQARAFGITQALVAAGRFEWETFRLRLIQVIGEWDAAHGEDDAAYCYYEHWLTALERVLSAERLTDPVSLAALRDALAARPHGHDHAHGHEHPH